MTDRVVLAYSGGLDTSVAIGWIAEQTGADVIAVAADVGQGGESLDAVAQRATACGAADVTVLDLKDAFADVYCADALRANALYQGEYPLVSALSRPLIAQHLVVVAQQHGASTVAHGCTGKGNDQVRFEAAIHALAPELSCLAPVRDTDLTRDKAIVFAHENGLPISTTSSSPYSIDQNVWGRSIETGVLEDPWVAPPEDCYSYTANPETVQGSDELIITFDKGIPTAIDGEKVTMLEAISALNQRAGALGVGRIDMLEDRLIGIKSREVYEAPGAMTLIAAHKALESLTVERDLASFKKHVEQQWTEVVYNGLWFSPLKNALDAFIAFTQQHVNGEVRVKLHAGQATVTGRKSDASLYDYAMATYDSDDQYDQSAAKGFVDIWGLSAAMSAVRDRKAKQ